MTFDGVVAGSSVVMAGVVTGDVLVDSPVVAAFVDAVAGASS